MPKEVFPGITVDPQVMGGRPVIKGTRIPIEVIVGELAGGSTFDDITTGYRLSTDEIRAALGYAAELLSSIAVYAAG